jgi:hypothetical protein
MRQHPDFFEGRELTLVFMARRLRDALKVEDLLTRSGVEYCVETGDYEGGLLFRRQLTGAFFYVDEADEAKSRGLLSENRFKPYDPRLSR